MPKFLNNLKENLFIINISLLLIFDSFNLTNKIISKITYLINLANINKYNLAILKDFVIDLLNFFFVLFYCIIYFILFITSYIFFCIIFLCYIWIKKSEEKYLRRIF